MRGYLNMGQVEKVDCRANGEAVFGDRYRISTKNGIDS